MPMNIVMGEDVLAPAAGQGRSRAHPPRTRADALQPGRHAHRLHPDGPRRTGDQPARGRLLRLRLGHAQARRRSPTLRQIAASLGRTPYDLRIEGHTDNIPIHNAEFDSNWELSTARATSIARLLLDLKAIPPETDLGRRLRRVPPRRQQRHRRRPRPEPPRRSGRPAPHQNQLLPARILLLLRHVAKNHRRTITPFRLHNPVVSIDSHPSAPFAPEPRFASKAPIQRLK